MSEQNSPSENQLNEWDRILEPKEESAKAYEAFGLYLELPVADRSVLNAYNRHQQNSGKKPANQTPGQWTLWSTLFRWKDRAAIYDSHIASEKRKAQEEERKAHVRRLEQEHLEKLSEFRDQLRDLNGASLSASVLLMDKCVQRLQSVSDEEIANLPLKEVGNLLKAAATAATAASTAQASALAVDELIGLLGDEKSGSEDT